MGWATTPVVPKNMCSRTIWLSRLRHKESPVGWNVICATMLALSLWPAFLVVPQAVEVGAHLARLASQVPPAALEGAGWGALSATLALAIAGMALRPKKLPKRWRRRRAPRRAHAAGPAQRAGQRLRCVGGGRRRGAGGRSHAGLKLQCRAIHRSTGARSRRTGVRPASEHRRSGRPAAPGRAARGTGSRTGRFYGKGRRCTDAAAARPVGRTFLRA